MVKIGERKERKIAEKCKLTEGGKFMNFWEIWGICIIDLGGWMPLSLATKLLRD